MKLKIGPAATVAARAQSGAPFIVRRRSAALRADMASSSVPPEGLLSPLNFTYPPKGSSANCHFVPRLSTRENSTGPKPSENTSASIPDQRPTM